MTVSRPRGRLVWRVYAFAAVMSVAIMIVLLFLPRYIRGARYLEPQAALLQHLVDRWSLKDGPMLVQSMERIAPRLRGRLTLYGNDGRVIWTNVDPTLDFPTDGELADLTGEKWSLSTGRIVVRSDDRTMIASYAPDRPGFPWSYVFPMGVGILLVVGGASIWFSRRLARPLGQLGRAARRFGAGDMSARAELHRHDELGDVGRAFDEMAHRTAAVLYAQRQLMADVSHELRTPLARIRVALELAVEDPTAAADVLLDVGDDLEEIDQLINDILTTARLDGEHVRIERRPTRVGDLAAQAAERFLARHPHRTLDQAISGGDRDVECDPMLVRRALDNLLDNAAKYSDATTPVRLAIADGPDVAFEVIDRGIGMTRDELDRAFTPFWRADSSRARTTGGVGLGLALARRIARAHGGDVTLASVPNTGTIARLELPATA
ncbi:MAG: HAMP domain-containing histidine kinase [Deltaproteobacteria bacterium]|nr:HAMP domain-containing histidine kinase [Deltaproteobacteria bacterium]MCW5804516.1 HAMP domain-containing histidine kinase [Deltaproteobacteria bacterium]